MAASEEDAVVGIDVTMVVISSSSDGILVVSSAGISRIVGTILGVSLGTKEGTKLGASLGMLEGDFDIDGSIEMVG